MPWVSREFGFNLRRVRERKGYSQVCLASFVGTSQQRIWAYEAGVSEPGPKRIAAICNVLGIAPNDLFDEEIEPCRQSGEWKR